MDSLYDDLDLTKMYKIYNVTHEMMKDRGFNPVKKQMDQEKYESKIIGYLAEELEPAKFLDKLALIFESERSESTSADIPEPQRVLVYFNPFKVKFRKVDTEYIHSLMESLEINYSVIIVNDKITSRIKTILSVLNNSQIFNENELVINITKHLFVPKHEKMTVEDTTRFYQDYKVTSDKVPSIFTTDPVVRYYNFKVGDLLRIHRPRGELYYRVVVE